MRAIALVMALIASSALSASPGSNIVIILADDLGYGDLSVQGHPLIRTPHIDQLAREGQRWTSFYSSAPICGPSRAGLMTGRMNYRWTNDGKNSWKTLPGTEFTIGEMLKNEGYDTAYIGKWGLSLLGPPEQDHAVFGSMIDAESEEYRNTHPNDQGFDYFFGSANSNDGPLRRGLDRTYDNIKKSVSSDFIFPLYRQRQIIQLPADQPTLTKRYTEEAVNWIQSRKKPFLLFLAYNAPHVPIFRSRGFEGHSKAGPYGDAIEEIDWSVGKIVEALRAKGLAESTLVFFSSDNGPARTYFDLGGSPGPFRDGKTTAWEGGFRVPGIFWWPGTIKPAVIDGMGVNVDVIKTIAAITGAALPKDRVFDSIDLSGTLLKGEPSPRKEWFFYDGAEGDLWAARVDNYKLVFQSWDSMGVEEQFCRGFGNRTVHNPPLLFDLNTDMSERRNIAGHSKKIVDQIQALVERHRKSIGHGAPERRDEASGKNMFGC